MRAVRMHAAGGPQVLGVDDVPEPRAPRGDELLVRVAASSVNGTDLMLRGGALKLFTAGRLPVALGFDLAGEVVARGPRVTAFDVGDRVLALVGHAGGAQADLVLVPQDRAALQPAELPDAAAAALPLAGLTALQALSGPAALHLRQRPRVLVTGASGGIGSFGVQLAKLAGAHVTAVTTALGADFARGLGADAVLDRTTTDWTRTGDRWHVVLDSPGRARFRDAARALEPDGVLVSTRAISTDALRLPRRGPRRAAVRTQARSSDLARLARLAVDGRLRVPLHRALPLEAAREAHTHAESGALGKVVLTL